MLWKGYKETAVRNVICRAFFWVVQNQIESGQRFVTDIELVAMAKVFGVTVEELIQQEE